MPELKLNLGCCDRHLPGYRNVDIAQPADQIVDLAGPWPWETSSVSEVLAYDVIEHIGDCDHVSRWLCPRCTEKRTAVTMGDKVLLPMSLPLPVRHQLGRIHFMNELHRVLVPGGKAFIETPNAALGVGFYCDPTHVTPWVLSSFKYFQHGAFAHGRLAKHYGITAAFHVDKLDLINCNAEDPRESVSKIQAHLRAAK